MVLLHFSMATSNNDNYFINNGIASNVSPVTTSSNRSSSHTATDGSPRRSIRLSSKSPQMLSRSSNQSNIHRTVSGGVTTIHSPKMNIRKRNSRDNGRIGYLNSRSQITHTTDGNNHDEDDETIMQHSSLPSDQSEDEETPSRMDNNNVINNNNGTAPSKLASRTEVLSYFEEQSNGFKCRLCNKVNLFINFFYLNICIRASIEIVKIITTNISLLFLWTQIIVLVLT